MAKKKSAKKSTSAKEFNNSPFKSLKGLSALEDKPVQKEPVKPVKAKSPESPQDSSFTDEMELLGVKPLSAATSDEQDNFPGLKPEVPKRSRAESDEEMFLDALGSMEKVFKDEWMEEERQKAAPRRMKQVERGVLKPEDELDLHGMTADAAADKVRLFLQRAGFNGLKTVRIITGRGLHSNEGSVLRPVVERLLSQTQGVVEWGGAPRKLGGEGALIVFLRGK